MPLKIMCISHDNISVNFTNGATLVEDAGVENLKTQGLAQ